MHRASCVFAAAIAFAGLTGAANATTITVTPADSVNYAANENGPFYVNSTGESYNVSPAQASATKLGSEWIVKAATAPGGYADAGIVLDMDGSLTLGQLQSASITLASGAGQTTPTINLWLDTGNDGQFFSFDGTGKYTSIAGDSYVGATSPGNINESSSFGVLGGSLSGGPYTLAQLQSGSVAGVDANTKVALWIGEVGTGTSDNFAFIKSVSLVTVPLPASVWSGMSLLAGLGLFAGVKRKRARLA